MRILKIIHTMGHGGAENIFRWLAWGLRSRGVDVVAGIPSRNDPGKTENWIVPALKELEIPHAFFDKQGSPLTLFRNLRSLIAEVKPDLVHSHLLDSNFYASLACKTLGVPHVCTEHGDITLRSSLSSRLKFRGLSLCSDAIICVSEAVREQVRQVVFSPKKLGVIYNGICIAERQGTDFRKEFDVSNAALVIGSVGNLYPVKGQGYLIRAFSGFLKSFPESFLVLVGRGGERERLAGLVKDLEIPERRVIFTGFRRDVHRILEALDIYVQPSLSEGFPVSVLDALFLGLPVIATAVGGVPEIIGRDEHGLLVPSGSWQGIQEALLKVASSAQYFREKAAASEKWAKERFSIDRMTSGYLEVYERILKRGSQA